MEDDKTLSQKIVDVNNVLKEWESMKPIATGVNNLVNEYGEVINGIGQFLSVVGLVWNIYSNMEKAKENAAQQQAMVEDIKRAVDAMVTRAQAEIDHHMDEIEDRDIVSRGQAIQKFFRYNIVPFAKTYPIKDLDVDVVVKVADVMFEAVKVIDKMQELIKARAAKGNGTAIMVLYRNLHAVVQCKLTMNRWRYGLTQAVISDAENDMTSLIKIWVPVVRGLERMSDLSFSQGLVFFQVGGHGRPKFTKYSYYYQGKSQPGSSSNMALVSQAFVDARKAGRSRAIPQELFEWNNKPSEILQRLRDQPRDQSSKMRATNNLHIVSHGTDTYLVGNCLDNNQHWNKTQLRLDSCLGDNGGHFLWGGSEFTERARNIRFYAAEGKMEVPLLRAELQDDRGKFLENDLNLAERINNRGGYLQFV
ncbi:unnamed protein product [Penicillium pancosmium]